MLLRPLWTEKKPELKRILTNVFNDFLRISTIHVVPRIFGRTSTKAERLFWSFGFITTSIVLSYVTWEIGYIYQNKPLKTVISELKRPIFKIPFPEVTICNRNRLNWNRLDEMKLKFLKPQHRNPKYEEVFVATLSTYDTLRYGKFFLFENITKLYPRKLLNDLNYINFTTIAKSMAWKCYEMLSDCFWMNYPYDCCELFAPRNSQQGQCLSFNSIENIEGQMKLKTDPYYPWRSSGTGPHNGLVMRIHTRENQHSPYSDAWKGVIVMLTEPHVWAYITHYVPTNTRATVSLAGFEHFHDDHTRVFSNEARQCVFEDELKSLFYKSLQNHKYMYENCVAECQQEYLMKFCNCSFDLFYPPGQYKPCGLVDLPCLYEHDGIFKNVEQPRENEFVAYHQPGLNCSCFFNCKYLDYITNIHIDSGAFSEETANPNGTKIEMSVFFQYESFIVYKTTAVYTVLDLMASLGGLASLCIGCSLVGITELFYFIFVDVPKQLLSTLKNHKQLNLKRKSLKTKKIFVKQKIIA